LAEVPPLEFVCDSGALGSRGALDSSVGLVGGEVERSPDRDEVPFRVVTGGVVLARVSVAVLVPSLVAASHARDRRGRPELLDVPSGRNDSGVNLDALLNVVAVGVLATVFTVEDAARGQAVDRGRGAEGAKYEESARLNQGESAGEKRDGGGLLHSER
jgi:hypothetical protein